TYQAQIDKLKKSVEEITALAAVGAIFDALAPADTVGQAGSTQEGPLPQAESNAQAAADQLRKEQETRSEIELLAQQELIDIRNAAELDGVITLNEALNIVDAEFKAGIIKSDEDHAAKRAAVSKVYYSEVAKGAANLFSALSSLAQEGSAEQKALATTAALINTYQGATAALAAPDVLPQPFALVVKLLSVAAVVASGLASVKKIQGFERGGFTDAARSNKKAVGVVHANEWVAPAHMVNDPNTGRVIDWLEYVRRGGFKRPQIPQQLMNNGFETGGFTSFSSSLPRPSISELLSASSTAELRAKEFTAQISVSEINNVQNRVAVTEQLSTA
ncbi:MAG TPA: hypothetical protein PLC10_15840, partial [Flavobacteriales bacterium]|nr:hypothetical protein [Flavobacteriales bacterium]